MKQKFLSYKEAKIIAQQLKIKNQKEWQKYSKGLLANKPIKPNNIPANPQKYYKNDGWKNWQDWLGTKNRKHNQKIFLPYNEAKKKIRSFNFKNKDEWNKFCTEYLKKESEFSNIISRNPNQYYKNKGWISWEDWLGCKLDKFLSYNDAKKYVTKLNIKTCKEWNDYDKTKLPKYLPKSPENVYKKRKEWVNWGDFLGTNNIAPKNKKH